MEKNIKNHVEILAPAGSYEAMTAAALGGCDAVYAAGMKYGARAYAKNFSTEELCRAGDYLHLRGKKLYVTMNTLIKEDETDGVFNTLKILYSEGIDAVIVQDMGLMKFIHENFPKLPIHASTQTSLMTSYGANLLKKSGVKRLIPARECSLSDIRLLRENTDMEIECFVHGALCFCYSGHCLFSSMNGGRSGNRGQCAQPCRKPYSLNNGNFSHILSPKDLCTLYILPDLIEAGIDSFKIEGRMKNPEYCVLTSFLYKKYSEEYYEHGREYYENFFLDENGERHKEFLNDIRDLSDIFNRGGFTTGYYKSQNGKDMMSEKRPNHFGTPVGTVTSFCEPPKGGSQEVTIMPDFDIQKDDVLEIRDSAGNTVLLINGSMNFTKDRPARFSPYGLKKDDRDRIRKLLNKEGSLSLYRLRNHALLNRLNENFLKEGIRNKVTIFKKEYPFLLGIPVKAYLSGRVGQALNLRLENDKESVSVSTKQLLTPADKEGFSHQRLSEQINKTGEYPFIIELDTDGLDRDCFIPMSLFNGLRRDAMEKLRQKIEGSKKRKYIEGGKPEIFGEYSKNENKSVISCSVISFEQAGEVVRLAKENTDREFELILNGTVCNAGQILEILRKLESIKKEKNFPKIYLTMPAVFPPRVQKIWESGFTEGDKTALKKEFNMISGIFVRTFDEIGYMKKYFPDTQMRADSALYLWNKKAAEFYGENGISYNTLSPELSPEDILNLDVSHSYLPVYGSVCLMVSAQCLIKNSSECKKDNFYHFKNKEGKSFFGINVCSYCYNLIFSEDTGKTGTYAEIIGNSEIYGLRFDFYRESPEIIRKTVSNFT